MKIGHDVPRLIETLGVSGKSLGCFKQVSRVFHGSYKGVSRKFHGCFKEVSRVFQGYFKGV